MYVPNETTIVLSLIYSFACNPWFDVFVDQRRKIDLDQQSIPPLLKISTVIRGVIAAHKPLIYEIPSSTYCLEFYYGKETRLLENYIPGGLACLLILVFIILPLSPPSLLS